MNRIVLAVALSLALGGIGTSQAAPNARARPYSEKVVTVACTGSGTPLADALSVLNPVADVYDVQITGTCTELVVLKNFSSIRLRSADPANAAVIGPVAVQNGNDYVSLEDLTVRDAGQSQEYVQTVQKFSVGRLELWRVTLDCARTDFPCLGIQMIGGGDLRAYGSIAIGNWSAGRVPLTVYRGGSAIVAPTASDVCSPFNVAVHRNSVVQMHDGDNCEAGSASVLEGGQLFYFGNRGARLFSIFARNGSVFGIGGDGSPGSWYGVLNCRGFAAIVADYPNGLVNYCSP